MRMRMRLPCDPVLKNVMHCTFKGRVFAINNIFQAEMRFETIPSPLAAGEQFRQFLAIDDAVGVGRLRKRPHSLRQQRLGGSTAAHEHARAVAERATHLVHAQVGALVRALRGHDQRFPGIHPREQRFGDAMYGKEI